MRAVLGHLLFCYVHAYPDGYGRAVRFLMNAVLVSGGYPGKVIHAEGRAAYRTVLEAPSAEPDVVSFAAFVAERVKWSV